MIKSFRSKETEGVFRREPSQRFGSVERIALRKLLQIDAAATVGTLRHPPGNRLELLRGDRAGQYSIRVNQKYRVCFTWREGHAYEVEITDYH